MLFMLILGDARKFFKSSDYEWYYGKENYYKGVSYDCCIRYLIITN